MNAAASDPREAYRTMTGDQYDAYLDKLVGEAASSSLKVVSAHELVLGRPLTSEEQAADEATVARLERPPTPEERAIEARLDAKWAREDAIEAVRDRLGLLGEKITRAFDAFRVIEASEFASGEDTEPDWQVRGLIPRQGTGLHPGPSGTLKSFTELDIAACIHRGAPFHGREVRKGRAVIVVAEGARGYKRRLQAYAKHNGVPLTELPAIIPAAPNLFEPNQISALIARLKLDGVTYVVLDTKWRCAVGSDENSASDQAVVLGSMDRIARELQCFCMAVTHTGRDVTKGARGSSSQYAAVDVELTQERVDDFCTVRCTKQKDSEDGAALTFKVREVDLGRNKHGEPVSSLVLEPVDSADAALAFKPKGKLQTAVWDYVRKSSESRFAKEALVADVAKASGSRADNVRRTIEEYLVGSLFASDGDDLTVLAGIVRDNAGWLEGE